MRTASAQLAVHLARVRPLRRRRDQRRLSAFCCDTDVIQQGIDGDVRERLVDEGQRRAAAVGNERELMRDIERSRVRAGDHEQLFEQGCAPPHSHADALVRDALHRSQIESQ